uniref:Glucosidase n=1 Tax=Kwoniella bestiolae CBS 10118 TaxID=1296100 RepID=A0A1B9G5C9_9TREE|nr:glucosidase [Kwoniella bestiolae CBS 10118]OCF26239.1 glucosidase [Kwoniella bestiolae CBS 10118]
MSHRGNPTSSTGGASYASFSSGNRFGPTANIAPTTSTPSAPSDAALTKGAYGAVGIDDDDDLDDTLHTFTAAERKDLTTPFDITSWRGWANAITLLTLAAGGIMLFAGYPIIAWYYGNSNSSGANTSGYNLGGINGSGQYPSITGLPQLIDSDTPSDAFTKTGHDGNEWTLVFSDEFNKDGRTFYDGDDPFFQAVDIHYWATGDFEWYDPSAATTKDGHLILTMTQEPIHDLNFKSGMIQSWNKLCFNKNAYIEVSASLPGVTTVGGFWPGVWTMGNLGRPGYGATTEGDYTYDSCDIGTLANQTYANGTAPVATLTTGSNDGPLSYLPGQRLSACTCAGEDHPGPNVGVGRAAPEIDMIEAQIILSESRGEVSQSFQVAPFDDHYQFNNASKNFKHYDTSLSYWNTYLGGNFQQAVSTLTRVPTDIYYNQPGSSKQFATFGVEWQAFPDKREDGYIAWYSDGQPSWTMYADAVAENTKVGIGRRIIPEEPMALIFNFGMSNNFQAVDFENLIWPNYVRIDYIRVYQRTDSGTIGCDPSDYPTANYITKHADAYNNPNFTTWAEYGQTFPKNRLIDTC